MTASEELVELELQNGILAFDGRVLERFGFGVPGREPTRLHVNEIEEVVLKGGHLRMEGRGRSSMNAHLEFEEAQLPELEAFLDRVRVAAPNLREGS